MNFSIVGVRLKNSFDTEYKTKEYHYKSYDELKVEDLVVVETPYGFTVGLVSSLNADISNRRLTAEDLKEVVCRCDLSEYKARKRQEIEDLLG